MISRQVLQRSCAAFSKVWRVSSVANRVMQKPAVWTAKNNLFRGQCLINITEMRSVLSSEKLKNGAYEVLRRDFSSENGDRESTSFHIQDYDDFHDRVLHADRPVVVQFHAADAHQTPSPKQAETKNHTKKIIPEVYIDQRWSNWCGPCKMLSPRLESMVDSREGRVLLAKVDIDDNQDLAIDYGVKAVPTVYAFNNGEKVTEFMGLVENETIKAMLNTLLNEDE